MKLRSHFSSLLRGFPLIAAALFCISTAVQVGCSDSSDSQSADAGDTSVNDGSIANDDAMTEDEGLGYGYGY